MVPGIPVRHSAPFKGLPSQKWAKAGISAAVVVGPHQSRIHSHETESVSGGCGTCNAKLNKVEGRQWDASVLGVLT